MIKGLFSVTLPDMVFAGLLLVYVMVVFAPPAYAYVDPSVMTYAIQAFAGVAVALGAVAGVALRRTRKHLFKLLSIDENANKEVEPDIHRLDAEGLPIPALGETAAGLGHQVPAKKRARGLREGTPLRWRGRLAYALTVSLFTVFTVFVVAPYEIVASNASDLVFGLSDVWLLLAVPAAVGAVCLSVVLTLLRGKAFQVGMLVVFSLGLAAYIQALLLNGALPTADGSAVAWDDYTTVMLVSATVWIAVIAAPLVLSRWFGSRCRGAAAAISVCLVLVQAVGIASLFGSAPGIVGTATASQENPQAAAPVQGKSQVTEEGLFEVAPKNNVIVLMLDMVDLRDFNTLVKNDPGVKDRLDGFTYFSNTTGSLIPTRYALPYLLTGELPQADETMGEYLTERYDRGAFLPEISGEGYSIGLYSDSLLLEPESSAARQGIADATLNIHPFKQAQKSATLNRAGALQSLWKCALYRDMPWPLKPSFWFYTDEVNNAMVRWDVNETGGGTPYTLNDFNYFNKLKNIGLSVGNEGYKGAFKLIHLQGSHYPYSMDENGQDVGVDNSTLEQQTAGVFKIVDTYLNQLRDLGVYDDSTLIIMSDHGTWRISEKVDSVSCPIMLVKPSSSSPHATSGPMKTSDVPASHLDFTATVIETMGLDPSAYGTPLFDLDAEPRSRLYYAMLVEGEKEVAIQEFRIDGDALDFSSWHETGRQWASG